MEMGRKKMGFRLERTYVLKFEGSALEGAEIKIRSTPVGTVLRVRETSDARELAEILAEYVTEWNLDDRHGEPLLITPDAILADIEASILAKILREWMDAASGVSAPLDEPSNSGGQFPEESISMETL